MRDHEVLIELAIFYYEKQGYAVKGREVIVGVLPSGSGVKPDLLIEKNGKIIPVECGRVTTSPYEKSKFYREEFGGYEHFTYGKGRKVERGNLIENKRRLYMPKVKKYISLDKDVVREIDKQRGLTPFSTYVNHLLREQLSLEREKKKKRKLPIG